MNTIAWHGTPTEYSRLTRAVSAHCTCAYDTDGSLISTCDAHIAMDGNQRFLDGMVLAYRIRQKLTLEEWFPK